VSAPAVVLAALAVCANHWASSTLGSINLGTAGTNMNFVSPVWPNGGNVLPANGGYVSSCIKTASCGAYTQIQWKTGYEKCAKIYDWASAARQKQEVTALKARQAAAALKARAQARKDQPVLDAALVEINR
jgi:hypothetical protein